MGVDVAGVGGGGYGGGNGGIDEASASASGGGGSFIAADALPGTITESVTNRGNGEVIINLVQPVPEPGFLPVLALLSLGLAGVARLRGRRCRM